MAFSESACLHCVTVWVLSKYSGFLPLLNVLSVELNWSEYVSVSVGLALDLSNVKCIHCLMLKAPANGKSKQDPNKNKKK